MALLTIGRPIGRGFDRETHREVHREEAHGEGGILSFYVHYVTKSYRSAVLGFKGKWIGGGVMGAVGLGGGVGLVRGGGWHWHLAILLFWAPIVAM